MIALSHISISTILSGIECFSSIQAIVVRPYHFSHRCLTDLYGVTPCSIKTLHCYNNFRVQQIYKLNKFYILCQISLQIFAIAIYKSFNEFLAPREEALGNKSMNENVT